VNGPNGFFRMRPKSAAAHLDKRLNLSSSVAAVAVLTCSNGEVGRDQQHRERGDVAGIDAVRMGK
jgi:hypothetical protein